jgi:hypothetical protein
MLMPSCFYVIAAMTELEALRAELKKTQQEAEQQKAAAARAEKELAEERAARGKDQARVLEVEDTLKGVYLECDALQKKEKETGAELKKLRSAHAEAQTLARADHEVL